MRGYLFPALLVFPTRQVEVDFGPLPVAGATFLVSDPDVLVGSRVLVQTALEPGTGKDNDEAEMDLCLATPFGIVAGAFQLFVCTADGSYLADKFKVEYQVSI